MDVVLLENVSAVVPSAGKRQQELNSVVAHLKSLGFGEVVIGTGDRWMMNRYDAALRTKYDIIYTQDDDCIISNIEELISLYKPDRIVANIKQGHLDSYKESTDGKVALVGWGAVFHKSLVNFDKYLAKFPDDVLFQRESDRIFTYLNEKELVVADRYIKDFPSAYGGLSYAEEHFKTFKQVVENLNQL